MTDKETFELFHSYEETYRTYFISIEEVTDTDYEVFIENAFTGEILGLQHGFTTFKKALQFAYDSIDMQCKTGGI